VAFRDFFQSNHWDVVDVLTTEPRAAELLPVNDLPLAQASLSFLDRQYPNGIYCHQKTALRLALAGENICLSTGTASGKSLVFQAAAINLLAQDPKARIMAIYPMKALGNEQRERWQNAMVSAGLAPNAAAAENMVGRIDGSVPPGFRMHILERSRIVVFTPDIIHAWLFSNLKQPVVIDFLRSVRLMVVDEVHAYSGVFGSNSALLFRRMRHLMSLLDARPQVICASATIANPEIHLSSLFGLDFHLIGPQDDTSPRFPLDVYLVQPPGADRFLDEVVRLLEFLTQQNENKRFIAFVDSRKQVELISTILNRLLRDSAKAAEEEPQPDESGEVPQQRARRWTRAAKSAAETEDEADPEGEVTGVLQQLNVLPYRAGYEDHDRRQIQERLGEGTLNGVVSTSALELGIDIPNLDICVLIGVPGSATSLQQRIGRIGRHGPGVVLVVNGGDVHDQAVFAHPQSFFQRPLAESTLYLENEHLQYIHVLCLSRQGGEHDQVLEVAAKTNAKAAVAFARRSSMLFSSPVQWPENFIKMCQKERAGETPRSLASLKMEAHDRPNYTFPLRDVESQFKVERRDGPNVSAMGSLSFAQLMREAYPGAIYYYATIPYRVTRVNVKAKVVTVRREKRYTTQPQKTLPAVFPRLTPGGIFATASQNGLSCLETSLLVRESIRGVVEQRGRTESIYPYPLSREMGFFQEQPYFSRNYFTTGVLMAHPALAAEGVNLEAVAGIVYEAFMLAIPFERQDIGFAADHFRVSRDPMVREGQPFLSIYDQIYGSLRLTARLLDPLTLGQVLFEAALLAGRQTSLSGSPASVAALAEMARTVFTEPRDTLSFGGENGIEQRDSERWERVVMPGSKGLMVRTNEEFHVMRIATTPAGLSYEGTPISMVGTGASVMPLLSDVAEIPGESQSGWYNLQTGEIEPAATLDALRMQSGGAPQPPPAVDSSWLRRMLGTYFDQAALVRLADMRGLPASGAKAALVDALLKEWQPQALLDAALRVYVSALANSSSVSG